MKYRREIDGLRAVALVPVVFSHAGFSWFKGTYVMIDLFFVISGYLITSLIAKEKTLGTFSAARFYERRARRLLPALFLMMFVSIPFAWLWLTPNHFLQFSKSLMAVPVFSSNFLFWSESGYFQLENKMKPFLQTWSLSVEEQFYLLFPLVFVWLWPKGKKKLISVLIFISLISLGCMHWGLTNDLDANWYLLPGRIWEFTLGAIIALIPKKESETGKKSSLAELMSVVGLTILLISVFTFSEYQPFPSFYTLLPLCGTALVIRFADSNTFVGKLLGSKPLVGIGLISYGVFVWHQALFAFARHYVLGEVEPQVYALLILISFVLAYFSWRFIEAPFRNLNFLKRRTFFTMCLVVSVTFITLGWVGVINKGFPKRFSVEDIDSLIEKALHNGPPALGRKRAQFSSKTPSLSGFIQEWKDEIKSPSPLKDIPLAMFGASTAKDIYDALRRNGYQSLGLFGSGCAINPSMMNKNCSTLAKILGDQIKNDSSIQYLALHSMAEQSPELILSYFQEVVEFWKPLNKQLIIFSDKPCYPYLKETLQKNEYPKPDFKPCDLSTRDEVKAYLKSQGVHLVNSKEIFCKITGNCDFKKGPRTSFKVEDFVQYDNVHLTPIGQKEYGRILFETDPVFKKIISEASHSKTSDF
jgi:peptidoglycan/LPS O-acetylase OafA/YrhL